MHQHCTRDQAQVERSNHCCLIVILDFGRLFWHAHVCNIRSNVYMGTGGWGGVMGGRGNRYPVSKKTPRSISISSHMPKCHHTSHKPQHKMKLMSLLTHAVLLQLPICPTPSVLAFYPFIVLHSHEEAVWKSIHEHECIYDMEQ